MHRTLPLIAVTFVLISPAALGAQGAFGSSLAISGREVYVGQPGNSYGPGVVYVFRADAQGAWRGPAAKKITRSDATNDDGFGSAIAVDGNTLLIGDAKADSESGVVYVFARDGTGGWRQTGSFTAPARHAGDAFGSGIVLANGRAYIATGIRGFGSMVFTQRSGTVYVFPKLAGRSLWSFKLGNWSFWLITFGISLMGLDLTLAGLQQGYMLMAGVEWLDSLIAIRPYWLVRTVAGVSMDIGMSLLVYNLMRTMLAADAPHRVASPTSGDVAVQGAP